MARRPHIVLWSNLTGEIDTTEAHPSCNGYAFDSDRAWWAQKMTRRANQYVAAANGGKWHIDQRLQMRTL